jgi:ribosome biogenesis GTPase
VLNKADLGSDTDARHLDAYARGATPPSAGARTRDGIDAAPCVRRPPHVFVGHSGVGKSTLLSALVPASIWSPAPDEKTGKGRHTTSAAVLLRPEPEFELIDTPGVRSFALWGIGARDLEQSYVEFRRHLGECRFGDCRHVAEPGCALRAAVTAGEISRVRFDSFLKLRDELEGDGLQRARETRGRP